MVRIIIGLLFFAQFSLAQQSSKYNYFFKGEVFEGFILRHHEDIGHLIKGRPTGFEISLKKQTSGAKNWESSYGFPEISYNFSFYDLKNNAQLGKILALSAGMGFHLLGKPLLKSDLQFYFGLGFGYSTKPYNRDNNNLNTVVGSIFTYNGNFKLAYHYNISSKLKIGLGLKLTHFSNGSIIQPNNGINIITTNIMASYKFIDKISEFTKEKKKKIIDKSIKYGASLRIGFSESTPNSGTEPFYSLSLIAQKRISFKSALVLGIEGFVNKSVEKRMKHGFNKSITGVDYKSVGIVLGHNLLVNKLIIITQIGFYVYKKYTPSDRIYQQVGVGYSITDKIIASIILKTHFSVAEVITYGIGIRL